MEPRITINGTPLTEAQAMTLRVAAGSFALDLRENGLGDDEHGQQMTALYLARLHEIFGVMAMGAQRWRSPAERRRRGVRVNRRVGEHG